MKIVDFSNREFKKIPELQLPRSVPNTEARLYLYDDKTKWNKKHNILKVFYDTRIMSNKLYIIGQLLENKEDIDIEELVMPSAIVSINSEIVGYIMPYIEANTNMSLLLNNPNVSLKEKLKYLKQIYEILQKIEKVKKLEGKFFLGDIHESNFIFDIMQQKIKVVDMDSCYINNSAVPVSRFLFNNFNLDCFPSKYPMTDDDRVIPSHNSQVLCFLYMLLNTLSSDKSYNWSMESHYLYLNYLDKLGMNKEVLKFFNAMYDSSPRLDFDSELLSLIDTNKNYSLQLLK